MKIISDTVSVPDMLPYLEQIADPSEVLLVDIETTGLRAQENTIYLIGCLYYREDTWNLIQWLDTTGLEEKEVLSSFILFAGGCSALIHYNGDRFDLPFIRKRIAFHGLSDVTADMTSIDLFKMIKPFRGVLGLTEYKQTSMEELLGIEREETAAGKELIRIYHQFIANPSPALVRKLTAHDREELTGLVQLLPLTVYDRLHKAQLNVYRAQTNYYDDYNGDRKEELFLFFRLPEAVPAPLYASASHCYVKLEEDKGVIKIPLYTESMKYFYANYKDYYYLPEEDMAIHRYLAVHVDKDHRIRCTPQTCYTRKSGTFLPQWSLFRTPFFKRAYDDEELFFEFTDECKRDRSFLSDYTTYVFAHVCGFEE